MFFGEEKKTPKANSQSYSRHTKNGLQGKQIRHQMLTTERMAVTTAILRLAVCVCDVMNKWAYVTEVCISHYMMSQPYPAFQGAKWPTKLRADELKIEATKKKKKNPLLNKY